MGWVGNPEHRCRAFASPVINPQQSAGEGAHLPRLVLQGPFGPGALNHRTIHTEKDSAVEPEWAAQGFI